MIDQNHRNGLLDLLFEMEGDVRNLIKWSDVVFELGSSDNDPSKCLLVVGPAIREVAERVEDSWETALKLSTTAANKAKASQSLLQLVMAYEVNIKSLAAESDRIDENQWRRTPLFEELSLACGQNRRDIAFHPCSSWADILLKARAFISDEYRGEDIEELAQKIDDRGGHAYIDDLAIAVLHDLAQLGGLVEPRRTPNETQS